MRTKKTLAKKLKQNRPIPQWIRMRTGNTIRCACAAATTAAPALTAASLFASHSCHRKLPGHEPRTAASLAIARPNHLRETRRRAATEHGAPRAALARQLSTPPVHIACRRAQVQREAAPLAPYQDRPLSSRRRHGGFARVLGRHWWPRRLRCRGCLGPLCRRSRPAVLLLAPAPLRAVPCWARPPTARVRPRMSSVLARRGCC